MSSLEDIPFAEPAIILDRPVFVFGGRVRHIIHPDSVFSYQRSAGRIVAIIQVG